MENGTIPISDETIEQFKTGSFGSDPGVPGSESSDPMEQLNEAVGWLLKTADSALRKKDERLGTDSETIGRVSELSVIVAKRNISDDILRNSPELFLGTILAGLAIEKGIVLKTIQEEQAEKTETQQESEKKETADNE